MMQSVFQRFILTFLTVFVITLSIQAQGFDPEKIYLIKKSDGKSLVGKIISDDSRELVVETTTIGKVSIPKHLIVSITEYTEQEDPELTELFSTRYFLTTNGLPIKKGDSYYQLTLLGPDIQIGVSDNIGVGFITTWIGSPTLFTGKYTNKINEKTSYAVGVLAGGILWGGLDSFSAVVPYGSLTFGNTHSNFSVSAGYGFAKSGQTTGGQWLFSVAGLTKITKSGTLVFDSLIMPVGDTIITILFPGYRISLSEKSSFQIGFPGVISSNNSAPLGLPMISWFRKF